MAEDCAPTTKAELRDALDRLVLRAHRNGVEVANGAYALDHDSDSVPDWDVHVTRIERREPDE